MLDASLIYPGLSQGSAPDIGPGLAAAGFTDLVLCAEEWQPPYQVDDVTAQIMGYNPEVPAYPGVNLIYAPADDIVITPPTREVLVQAVQTANEVVKRVQAGGNVLVTCWAGRNRSGLVTALSLHKLTGFSGVQCVHIIRTARPMALTNLQFRSAIKALPSVAKKVPVAV